MATEKPKAATPTKARATPKVGEPPMPLTDLARAIIERTHRPRVGDVRRLAEAVLAFDHGKSKKGKAKKKADKKRKLAKIPGAKKSRK